MAVAELFATLVGLFVMFRDERERGTNATKEEFIGWLEAHKHEEIKKLLIESSAIGLALDQMLKDQHGQVMGELSELNKIATGLAHSLSSLSGLAAAVDAAAPPLSSQARSVLQQFNETGATKAIQITSNYGSQYKFSGVAGVLRIDEPRFIDDDLTTLVSLGLLLRDFNSRGSAVLTITRAGAAIGKPPYTDS